MASPRVGLVFMPHESSRLRQLWLREEHVRTSLGRARGPAAPRFGLDRLGAPARLRCSARLSQSRLLYEASLIHTLLGSLKAATANSFELRQRIARCWFSSIQVW